MINRFQIDHKFGNSNKSWPTLPNYNCPRKMELLRRLQPICKEKVGKNTDGGPVQKRSKRNEQNRTTVLNRTNRTEHILSSATRRRICSLLDLCEMLWVACILLAILVGCLKYCLVKCCIMTITKSHLHNIRRCNQCQDGFCGFDIKLALVHFVFPIRRKWV